MGDQLEICSRARWRCGPIERGSVLQCATGSLRSEIAAVAFAQMEEDMAMSLDAAAEVFREAMREAVKRYSLWYLIEGALLVVAGILAIIYPMISSVAAIVLLGWLLIISGVLQGVELARRAPCAAFLAPADLRDPGHPDRRPFPARPGAGAADDHAPADRLLHDRRNIEGRVRAHHPAVSQLGMGSRERAGRDRPVGRCCGPTCL